jgi:DNA recombination protein RmuC
MLQIDIFTVWAVIGLMLIAIGCALFWRQRTYHQKLLHELDLKLVSGEKLVLQERLTELQARGISLDQEMHSLQEQLSKMNRDYAKLEAQLTHLTPVETQWHDSLAQQELTQKRLADLGASNAELQAKLQAAQTQSDERKQLLEQAVTQMRAEFQTLAQQTLEEKTVSFAQANQTQLGSILLPLREQIDGFRKMIVEAYDKDVRERLGLKHELELLKGMNQKLGDEATALTRALKGESRVQGAWGEMILERLLEDSGLEAGRGYEAQFSSVGGQGGRQRPDVIIRLPDQRDIVIDAKVSLTAYERYCSAESDESRKVELHAHVRSIREHIKQLSERNYSALEGVHSLDFVLMFVPIESALIEAVRADEKLYRDAMEKNVAIVTVSTLLTTLRTVAGLWKMEDRNRHAIEIAQRAGLLYDKFVGFATDLDKLGSALKRTQDCYDDARNKLTQGSGNLVRQTEELRKLGAKTQKKLEPHWVEREPAASEGIDIDVNHIEESFRQTES